MFTSRSRKRPRSKDDFLAQDVSLPQVKRQKRSSSSLPPAFWDNLSKISLTKRALRELNRRQTLVTSRSSDPRHRSSNYYSSIRAFPAHSKQIHEDAAGFLQGCSAETSKDINRFSRLGGPDLTDIVRYPTVVDRVERTMELRRSLRRGGNGELASAQRYNATVVPSESAEPAEPAEATDRTADTVASRSTGVYDQNFHQNLVDHGVYPERYRYPGGKRPPMPKNWQTIKDVMAARRPSISSNESSNAVYERFVDANLDAAKEKQVSDSVLPLFMGEPSDAKCVAGGIAIRNLDQLTDGTLKPGNPDNYDGARPEQLNREVRKKLSGHIVPTSQDDLPIVPNFVLAVKGPDGSLKVAGHQARYDGALAARGMHSLQSYGQKVPVYDENAYTISSTYHGGTLDIYTSHLSQPDGPGTRPEYHMNLLRGYAMTGSPEEFRSGVTAFRNLREWTEKERNSAINRANATMKQIPKHQSKESMNSLDEVVDDDGTTSHHPTAQTEQVTDPVVDHWSGGQRNNQQNRKGKQSRRPKCKGNPLARPPGPVKRKHVSEGLQVGGRKRK